MTRAQDRRNRAPWIKRSLIALGGGAAVWTGVWSALALGVQQGADQAVVLLRQDGIAAGFRDADIGGFPARWELTLTDLELGAGDALLWSTQAARIEAPASRPNQVTLDLSQAHRISGSFGGFALEPAQAAVTLLVAPSWDLPLADLQLAAEALQIVGEDSLGIAVDAVAARLSDSGAGDGSYTASLTARDLDASAVLAALPADYHSIPQIALSGGVIFDRPWDRHALAAGNPVLRGVIVQDFQMGFGPSAISANGQLVMGDSGRPSGEVTITVDDWRPLFALARAQGLVAEGTEEFILAALEGLAQANGNPEDITLPLALRDGRVTFGAITLGILPLQR